MGEGRAVKMNLHVKTPRLKLETVLFCRPGNYEHEIERNRQVQWHQSFGSAPIKLPDVKVKSTIGSNTAKLLSTRDAKKHHRRLAYLKLYWD